MTSSIEGMKLSDFDYNLSRELIAQHPLAQRDTSRLMALDKKSGRIEHHNFNELPSFLEEGDLVVLNNTKVFNARLFGKREGFDGKIEILLTDRLEENLYSCLCRPLRRFKEGTKLIFGNKRLEAEVIGGEDEFRTIRFHAEGDLYNILEEIGEVPLPPYIKRAPEAKDEERYQTVYADKIGAIAAPTAGLHFTEDLIDRLKVKGVTIAYITLHVGYATFKAVKEDDITKHKMHKEYFSISKEAADKIENAKVRGGRIFAVGTTVCRTLESAATKGRIGAMDSATDLFIYPGFDFKVTDCLVTNFHLPRTTLLMLVSAFAGKDNITNAYNEAVKGDYRFYSYGDAMLVL